MRTTCNDHAEAIRQIAGVYTKFLSRLSWEDPLLIVGAREGLNKFTSNVWLSMFVGNKYLKAQLISPAALRVLQGDRSDTLALEHMVPKSKFIHAPCEAMARKGRLTERFVHDLLRRYWFIATVLESENTRLSPRIDMPDGWDEKDIGARYRVGKVQLIVNPYFPFAKEIAVVEPVRSLLRA